MATLTITLTASAIVPNSSKSYTISDADLQSLLNWAQSLFTAGTVTNQQILLAWIQGQLITPTITNVRNFSRAAPPPPISIA